MSVYIYLLLDNVLTIITTCSLANYFSLFSLKIVVVSGIVLKVTNNMLSVLSLTNSVNFGII